MNDLELIKKAQSGDRKAEEQILLKYKYVAKECAKKYFLAGFDEDDLISEGMIALLNAIKDFKEDKEASFKTFAYLCVDRRLLSKIRSSQSNKNKALNDSISITNLSDIDYILPEEYTTDSEENETISLEELNKMIDEELTDIEQKVTRMYLEGKTYQEIAEKLNKNVKAIDGALQRSKTKLRKARKG